MKGVSILTNEEYQILKKYKEPQTFDKTDKKLIYNLQNCGWMKLNFIENLDQKLKETAITTRERNTLVQLKDLQKNPITRTIYRTLSNFT